MTSRIAKLFLAAALTAAVPAAASAHEWEHEHDGRAEYGWSRPDAPRGWREGAWRARRLAEIRAELRALDAERADFYARHAWSPWRQRRYDRWWLERRAELERREAELQWTAWR